MEYQSLSKNIRNIGLYYKFIDEKIFKDSVFIELMNLVSTKEYKNINYALYTDSFLLKNNIFIPNFHTLYLSSGKHHIILNDYNDSWLLDIFPNNEYYIINNINNEPNGKLKIINSIQDIIKGNA